MMNSNRVPNMIFPILCKPMLICGTIIFILTIGKPDLLDAIIQFIVSFAK